MARAGLCAEKWHVQGSADMVATLLRDHGKLAARAKDNTDVQKGPYSPRKDQGKGSLPSWAQHWCYVADIRQFLILLLF